MTLTENETRFFIWLAVSFIASALWLLKKFVGHVESISKSVSKMEKDLAILTNDHVNLKGTVIDHHERLKKLEDNYA